MAEQGSKTGVWQRRLLDEHPGLVVSAIYFFASAIGLVYSWAFLRSFGINVFRYAEVSDFLLASLKEPFTWFLTLLAIAGVMLDNANSRRTQRRGASRFMRWYSSERYRQVNVIVLVFAIIVILMLHADNRAEDVRNGEGETISVHIADESISKPRVLLGTTGRFIFLYDPVSEMVDIHPHESIVSISRPLP